MTWVETDAFVRPVDDFGRRIFATTWWDLKAARRPFPGASTKEPLAVDPNGHGLVFRGFGNVFDPGGWGRNGDEDRCLGLVIAEQRGLYPGATRRCVCGENEREDTKKLHQKAPEKA